MRRWCSSARETMNLLSMALVRCPNGRGVLISDVSIYNPFFNTLQI